MAVATTLRGFNDLGHAITLHFFPETDFIDSDLTRWPYSLTKPDCSDLGYSWGHVLSKTKSVAPNFFAILAKLIINFSALQVLKEICT